MTEQPGSLIVLETIKGMAELSATCPPGCFVEFGVYQGGSAWALAQVAEKQGRKSYLYDTFTSVEQVRRAMLTGATMAFNESGLNKTDHGKTTVRF